jgi:hypothetical protein
MGTLSKMKQRISILSLTKRIFLMVALTGSRTYALAVMAGTQLDTITIITTLNCLSPSQSSHPAPLHEMGATSSPPSLQNRLTVPPLHLDGHFVLVLEVQARVQASTSSIDLAQCEPQNHRSQTGNAFQK